MRVKILYCPGMENTQPPRTRKARKRTVTKQDIFIQEYFIDFNASQAAIRAGYTIKSAGSTGPKLLKIPRIAAALEEERARRAENSKVSIARVVEELAKIAFFDPRKLYDRSGNLIPVCKLDDATAANIGGVKVSQISSSGGVLTEEKELKFLDKKGSLDSLMRHLGGFVDKTQVTGADGGPLEYKDLSDRDLDQRIQILINRQNVTINK